MGGFSYAAGSLNRSTSGCCVSLGPPQSVFFDAPPPPRAPTGEAPSSAQEVRPEAASARRVQSLVRAAVSELVS
jgi:hypothetical protein